MAASCAADGCFPTKWIALDLSVTPCHFFLVVYSMPQRAVRKQIHENAKVHKYLLSSQQLHRWLYVTCPSQSALCGVAFSCFKWVLMVFFRLFEAFRPSSVDTACATDYTTTGAAEDIYCPRPLIWNFHSIAISLWRAVIHGGTVLLCGRQLQLLNHFLNLYEWMDERGEEKRGDESWKYDHY